MILRHTLRGVDMTPFQSNVAAFALMVLYFKLWLETLYWLRSRNWLGPQYSRDLVHVAMSTCVFTWSLFDPSHQSWRLVALVPSVLAARFLYKVSESRELARVVTRQVQQADCALLNGTSLKVSLGDFPAFAVLSTREKQPIRDLSLFFVWFSLSHRNHFGK
jgi:hypothetical protein